jgi:hypothetical protein
MVNLDTFHQFNQDMEHLYNQDMEYLSNQDMESTQSTLNLMVMDTKIKA